MHHRALQLVVLGLSMIPVSVSWADCARPFATADEVLTFHIRVTRSDWDVLRLAPAQGSGCSAEFPRVKAEFKCGDAEPWIPIGAHRKRGDQRGRDTDQKPPLKLDFNFVASGQSWPAAMGKSGYRKLSLNQGQHDEPGGVLPDLLSEYIALRLMKREVPVAPSVGYARLYVQFTGENKAPEYHGLYVLIEDYDRSAMRRRYGAEDNGALYKTTAGGCRNEVFVDMGANAANAAKSAYDAWNARTPAGDWRADTAKAMNLEELLRHEAVRDLLANFNDTVLGSHYSNFAYFDSATTAMRRWFPWDLDDCFKGPVAVGTTNISTSFEIIPSSSPLGTKTRNHAAIRPRYLEVMCQLINGTMAPDRVVAELDQVYNATKAIVAEEAGPVWGGKNPLDESKPWTYGWEYRRMRSWYPARVASVRQQIEQKGVKCPVGCSAGAMETCQVLNCPGKRRCDSNLWTACTADPGCTPGVFPAAPPPPAPPDGGIAGPDGGASADAAAAGGRGGAGGSGAGGSSTAMVPPAVGGRGGSSPSRGGSAGTAGPGDSTDGNDPMSGKRSGSSAGCTIAGGSSTVPLGLVLFVALSLVRRRRRAR